MPQKTKSTGVERGTFDREAPEARGRFVRAFSKGTNLAQRTITGVASTVHVDRYDEIILPTAFAQTLPAFLASHAPLIAHHNYGSPSSDPTQIGWILDLSIERERIPFTARFANDPDGAAERWWKLASDAEGKGIAFSIGFLPRRWMRGTVPELIAAYPELREVLAGRDGDDRILVHTEIELLEISCVAVPANRQSLQDRRAAEARFWADDDGPARHSPEGDGGQPPDLAELAKGQIADALQPLDGLVARFADAVAELEEVLTLSSDLLACGEDPGARAAAPGATRQATDESDGGSTHPTCSEAARRLRRAMASASTPA